MKLEKLLNFLCEPKNILWYLNVHGFFCWIPDKVYIKLQYKNTFKKKLNLTNPVTYNEKLQWLKLYYRKPCLTSLVDKCEVRQFVKEKIGDEHIITQYGVWDRFEDIDFSKLPEKFVLKCTHDSGSVIICKDKSQFDKKSAKKTICKRLRQNYYWRSREWPYRNVKPRIIAEQFLENTEESGLTDYKIFCFNGIPKMILVCKDRFSETGVTMDFYDTDWNHLDIWKEYIPNSKISIDRPQSLKKMLQLAETLSQGMPHVRVDFYTIGKEIYFGELTFSTAAGLMKFVPDEWDYRLGEWFDLPAKKQE